MVSSVAPSAHGRGISRIEVLGFVALVLLIAWPFGAYTRPPFDDEVFTLGFIRGSGIVALFKVGLTGSEVHPFVSYVWFQLLTDLGLPPRAMGAVSLLLTVLAFLLVLDLTLRTLPVQSQVARLSTLFLFGAFPLLYGAGDAMRWYPVLAFLVALAMWLELTRGPTIGGGLILGLAASTNYLAIFAYLAFAARRYLVQRRFNVKTDGLFHLAVLLIAWPGIVNFVAAMNLGVRGVTSAFLQLGSAREGLASLAETALGFFGGYRLGIFNGALALPYVGLCALSIAALACALWRGRRDPGVREARDLALVTAIMSLCCVLYSLVTSFDRARALLFVAPFVTGCFALGYWRLKIAARWSALPLTLVAFVLFSAAIGAGRLSDEPFKRNLAIPFDEVAQFVADNTNGDVLVASSETVTAHFLERANRCVVGWGEAPPCLDHGTDGFRFIVIVANQNLDDHPELVKIAHDARQHRQLVATARFGLDRTAALKNRLTGAHLDKWLLTVEIYR